MAANSQGISTLLQAEKEAANIVSQAREYRTQRIKDARGEASKEIDSLKASKDKEFAEFEKTHSGDAGANQGDLDTSTEQQLASIQASFDKNRAEVVDKLLSRVVEVSPKLHKNYNP